MARYAQGTEVDASRSKAEIEHILERYGADQFKYGWDGNRAVVGFRADSRMIRMELPLPDRRSDEFRFTETGRPRRSDDAINEAYQQEVRRRWRALALVIKAKLEAVETGIAEFEDEFLAYIVLSDGSSAGDFMRPQIAAAYEHGVMPKMLPLPDGIGEIQP